MGQVMNERRINPDVDTFTANDMARAIRAATGVPVNHRELGALLDRMGVTASRRGTTGARWTRSPWRSRNG